MRILIVEDDPGIRESLAQHFRSQTFAVDTTECGERGSFLARTNDYDAIILDYILPKKSGLEVCKDIRACGRMVPILILSVRSAIGDKVDLLNLGADDYMTKPFSAEEILARVYALLRRPPYQELHIICRGPLTVDSLRQEVTVSDKQLYLTRKEFALLEFLARNEGKVMSRGMIMEHVWDIDADPFSNTIEAHIFNIRKKLLSEECHCIHTVPGRGYKFEIAA